MTIDRRGVMATGLGLGLAYVTEAAADARRRPQPPQPPQPAAGGAPTQALAAGSDADQTAALQAAIDDAAARGAPLVLAPGRYRIGRVMLRPGSILTGSRATTLVLADPGPMLTASGADDVEVSGLTLDGGGLAAADATALIAFERCARVRIDGLAIRDATRAIALDGCSGRITRTRITSVGDVALFSIDATGLAITDCDIEDCANNAIQVWRRAAGEDGTVVAGNRIARVRARSGGSGQNGNGINVFRAGGVLVEGNRITDCAYSAVRANAASNIAMVANSCARIGEVALYAEFGFEGALIAANLVDGAAAGISVTNFNEGGRLAVVQGNLIRNLVRREAELIDKRGEGITVEADASVTGNTIENAATAGLVVGWGPHMRDVVATGNLVRGAPVGILVSADIAAGACFLTNNMIAGARQGAIRAMRDGKAFGPDLVADRTDTGRVRITGNMAV